MQPTFQVTFEMKKFFFDRPAVINAVDKKKRAAISKSLAFVRTRARSLLGRQKKKVSRPGKTPSVHTAGKSLKTILFAYDPATEGGVVGPVRLNQVNTTFMGQQTVPSILEFGATVKIPEVQFLPNGMWFRRDLRRTRTKYHAKRTRTAVYKPRPFMSKALQIEQDAGHILSPWANVVGN